MDFETYQSLKRADYSDFAETVASILAAAIRGEPSSRLQQVQHRAKDPVSLKKKLEHRRFLDTTTLEADIKDLAGCRLVFYTNSDVTRFLSSGIVPDNFSIDRERSKIHYPRPDSDQANDLFISHNYVVKLGEDRSALPEYARFRDMWCEVQVQTTLNHAWSEMAHDTIYKRPTVQGFGGELFQAIEKRMQTIMRQFLIPAGYEFQKVLNDFERLLAGKTLFHQGGLDALSDCADNNARYDILRRFSEYVLPNYDNIQDTYPDIRARVIAAVKEARNTETRPIETPFGVLQGRSIEQVVNIAANIFEYLRYLDIETTFDVICELFPGSCSDLECKRLIQLAHRLSKHDLDVWERAGPVVQSILVERIQSLEDELLGPLRPILFEVLGEVLKSEVTGTSHTYESVTIRRGPVQMSDALARTRSAAIGVLKKLYRKAATDDDRRVVIKTLSVATATPYAGGYSNALLRTILENARENVEFYTEIADAQSYEILQVLENGLFWLYRRNQDLPNDATTDPQVANARDRLTESILTFRDRVNKDRSFVIYKILVGLDSVFAPAWDNKEFDKRAYREQRITELVSEVTEGNSDAWLRILERCAQTKSNELMTFPSFGSFLEQLGETKPDIAFQYLDRLDEPLGNFLPMMLRGLSRSDRKDDAHAKVGQWVRERRHLPEIVWYLRIAEDLNVDLLEKAVNAALENSDDAALLRALQAAVARHKEHEGGLIDGVFIPAFTYFTAENDLRWVDAAWHDPTEHSLFRDLRPEQADSVLNSLVLSPRIEYTVEDVIASIAETQPEKVLDFLGERIKSAKTQLADEHYEPIPFSLHDLGQPLSKIPGYAVDAARGWFEEDSDLFTYNGGRLLAIIFSEFSKELSDKLASFVDTDNKRDIKFVLSILRNYEAPECLHGILKEVIEALSPEDPLLDEVEVILESTGSVVGEFGFVEAYTRKSREIEAWRADGRAKVRSFAERELRALERQIASEQRRSEERLELRKRSYGKQGG